MEELAATEERTHEPSPDFEAIRKRVLRDLNISEQTQGYKAVAKALALFIKQAKANAP